MSKQNIQDKLRGSLIGGAVGDALGYPVEFEYSFKEIEYKYGKGGIRDYDLSYPWLNEHLRNQEALFSDDTQMTLYTAEGLLYAVENDLPILPTICNAYMYWMGHQTGKNIKGNYPSALAKVPELNQRRAPGNTCITALEVIHSGREPYNDSKGCGGIMRIAPIALYGAAHEWTLEMTANMAGEVAEITHLHPMSTISSACCAAIIQQCVLDEDSNTKEDFKRIVKHAMECVRSLYQESPFMDKFLAMIDHAMDTVESPLCDPKLIENFIGEGWIAEETLAIAIFSVLRHINSVEQCLICSVNHGGDSDSTGAVAGNIIGAIHGLKGIPQRFVDRLQLKDLIIETADNLAKQG